MIDLYLPQSYPRPLFSDCPIDLPLLDGPEWTVELKQDGIYGIGICRDKQVDVYSRAFDYKGKIELDYLVDCVLIGEFMFGSNWAYRHGQVGMFHAFDILAYEDESLIEKPLSERRQILEWGMNDFFPRHPFIKQVEYYAADLRHHLWAHYVDKQDYEGLVYKRNDEPFSTAHWYRTKKLFSVEYIFCGVTNGAGKHTGRAGAILGGLVGDDGKVHIACSIGGGLSDEFRQELTANVQNYGMRVFTATGNKIFDSGALRHPNFKEWRDDKSWEACTFEAALANRGTAS